MESPACAFRHHYIWSGPVSSLFCSFQASNGHCFNHNKIPLRDFEMKASHQDQLERWHSFSLLNVNSMKQLTPNALCGAMRRSLGILRVVSFLQNLASTP
jgi:hypothetical protein